MERIIKERANDLTIHFQERQIRQISLKQLDKILKVEKYFLVV